MCKNKKEIKHFCRALVTVNICILNLYIQGKLKMCTFFLKASVQKSVQNFLAKIVLSAFFCSGLSRV